MNSEWGEYELGDIGKIVTGKTPPSKISDLFGSEIPFVTPSDMDNRKWIDLTGRYLSQKGADLLRTNKVPSKAVAVSCIGSDMGKARLLKRESVTNQQINTIVVDMKKFDPEFIYYNLLVRQKELKHIASGSATPILSKSHFSKIKIKCPNLSTQKKCARVLSIIDDKISLLHETNSTLESIAQALFKSWFIDFDPVHAKAEAREPEGIDAETAALFPDSFKESELGLIPKGWRVGKLSDLSTLNPESWSKKNHPEKVLYIDLANAKDNIINEIAEYSFDNAPSRAKRVLRDGDTIIGTVRPGNRSFALIKNAPPNLTGSTGFAVIRPSIVENTEFLYLAITTDSNIEYLTHVADGGAYPAVRPEVIINLKTIIPSLELIKTYHCIVKPMFSRVSENQQKIQLLTTMRDNLLPKLISGQLCINNEILVS